MNTKTILGGFIAAALTISAPAWADSQGKNHGKGNSAAAHGQKAQRDHSEHGRVMQDAAASKKAARRAANCPPGLAKKNNGCVAPGQAKKRFARGERLPAAFLNNKVPAAYADQYPDTTTSLYRYSAGNVYRIDRGSRRVAEVISVPTY